MVNRIAIIIQIGFAGSLTVGELAEIFGAPIARVHALVLDLEKSGLICRSLNFRGAYALTIEGVKVRADARRAFEEISRPRRNIW